MGKETFTALTLGPVAALVKKKLFKDSPSVSNAAAMDVEDAKKKAKRSRSQLIMNEAGLSGQDLNPTQIGGNNRILGN